MKSAVRAKKHLGQHFLNDLRIAEDIVDALTGVGFTNVIEIGPGMGVLTSLLFAQKKYILKAIDLDRESILYLQTNFPMHASCFIQGDFLKEAIQPYFNNEPFAVIGNFPYNISSQILFKVLDHREHIPELVGMFQHEVALRIAAGPGSKTYGVTSVLLQAHYDIEYLFTVPSHVFTPPPKVQSAVIRMRRKVKTVVDYDEKFFKTIVKSAFNQRRKTLRNSLKAYLNDANVDPTTLQKRPEQLSFTDFIALTNQLQLPPKP
jgi:16S rRNA (adenine1518-N6/adenine1519-N6)-dimethyltransferase